MEEKTFFEQGAVKVTNARFINGSQTFAMRNITSVKASEVEPNRTGGILIVILGSLIAMSSPILGGFVAAIAGLYVYHQQSSYHIMLSTAGGETSALVTSQRDYLDQVVAAINEAIVFRG